MATEPRQLVEQLETAPSLPAGPEERFNGYGVMGIPFKSGHVLAMRRFPSSSVGPGYISVWHRSPDGDWVFYANVPPNRSCPRYFGAMAVQAIETEIMITWLSPYHLRVAMPPVSFEWEITAGATVATGLMNTVARLLPSAAWHNSAVLTVMGMVAGPLLGIGGVRLHGNVPNGQRFIANPRTLWAITDSRAVLRGKDFGPPGPVRPQAHLGDFWIPQRGILALGQSYFDPFDPARHSSMTVKSR